MDEYDAVARTEIQPGWEVYDADGVRVGTVGDVGDMSFTIKGGGIVEATTGVGFDQIESADDGRVDLSVTAQELAPAVDEGGAG